MPMDIRDRPARYGDGSGIVTTPPPGHPDRRDLRERREKARHDAEQKRVMQLKERARQKAIRDFFGRVFGDD